VRRIYLNRPHIRGRDVNLLQRRLQAHSIPCDDTGVFDCQTYLCVKRLQAVYHLPSTGVVDDGTWKVLLGKPPMVWETVGGVAVSNLISVAHSYLGVPFIWGASDPKVGFDSLGFVLHCLELADSDLLKYYGAETVEEFSSKVNSTAVEHNRCYPGDLVFYSTE